ncbi:MAG: large conductance mechanosensitive channel protein MscL [Firmicutes bacterium]|nr:large conductance mechanosensitive channel protein MscL [Bacillota bacterium]MCL2771405.1 large conductance mechanosensitive channel protein MscL [Bacillota bacterium]
METNEKVDETIPAEIECKKTEKKLNKALARLNNTQKGFFTDFKKFMAKGNVIQLAVAFIMGGAFSAIVNSLVEHVFMPLFGPIVGAYDIAGWTWTITDNLVIGYGHFLLALINFLLISFVLFMIIKLMTSTQSRIDKLVKKGKVPPAAVPTPEPPKPTKTEELLEEIKNLLAAQAKK